MVEAYKSKLLTLAFALLSLSNFMLSLILCLSVTISLCMSLPDSLSVYFPMLPVSRLLCQDVPSHHLPLHTHTHFPFAPLHPSFQPLSLLVPNQDSSLCPFPDTTEGERSSSEGVFVVKLTCAVFTKRMSRAGLCPGSTVCMTHSFVMHWSVCLLLPKRCPGSHPNSLLILSALRLRGKTQAQNGCRCHCTVLSLSEEEGGCCVLSFMKNEMMHVLQSAFYVETVEIMSVFSCFILQDHGF